MAQLSQVQMAQAGFPDRNATPARSEKYHPHCGDQHRDKPAKALIGIALLIALSVSFYAITASNDEQSAPSVPQHTETGRR